MISLIDLVYYSNNDCNSPAEVLEKHKPALGFVDYIKDKIDISLVKHCNYEGKVVIKNVVYAFFKRKNSFFQIPYKTHSYIKGKKPDVVIINGLIFPIQVMALKLLLGHKVRLVAQHHGERPYEGVKGFLQKIADRSVSEYLFTSKGNAEEWIRKGIIRSLDKCHEVLEASTYLEHKDKASSKALLQFTGNNNFLWVGRLNENKDPLLVLTAFLKYLEVNSTAHLFMIYQDENMLDQVKSFIILNRLDSSVTLKGFVAHSELSTWFSAADFYISASKKEGSGYALIEAMACGCIPIVTDIPAFKKITANGGYGFLFPVGDKDALYKLLVELDSIDKRALSLEVRAHFKRELSFEKIASDLINVIKKIKG